MGGCTEREVKGRTAKGEGAGWEGKGKVAIVSETCGHQAENGESPCGVERPRIANG